MDLDYAVTQHVLWKTSLRTAIEQRKSVDAAVIGANDRCELGLWLKGEGKARYGVSQNFAALEDAHTRFHNVAGQVATLINGGDYEAAQALIGKWGEFKGTSTDILAAASRLSAEKRAVEPDRAANSPSVDG